MQFDSPKHKAFYPFLIAAYPVLALLAHNIEVISPWAAFRSLLVSLLLAGLVFVLVKLLLKSWERAALIASVLLILFFSYGHVYNAIEGQVVFGFPIGRHRFLFSLWGAVSVALVVWLVRKRSNFSAAVKPLNVIGIILLIFPALQIGLFGLRSYTAYSPGRARASLGLQAPAGQPLPDIYYIILDGYTRDDILLKNYQLDNRPFLESLSAAGFYIARCSQSNYAQTQLSLASSLNYNYLEALGENYRQGNTSRAGLADLIQHSAIRRDLENLGYTMIAFETGFEATQIEDADQYLAAHVDLSMNDFENMFVRSTAARVLSEGVAFLNLRPDWEARDQAHREQVLFSLQKLRELPDLPGPKFVFAHIVSPHWPHVFGPNGEPVHELPDSATGYRNQVLFLDKQMQPILENIIANSVTPPIIIVQGDHGSIIESPKRRMSILNMYYLPDGGEESLYEGISPVNTFRVILNRYFGADLPLLADRGYYSTYDKPYDYELIPEERSGCQSP